MQQPVFESLLSEVRRRTQEIQEEAAGLEQFVADYPPLKLADIKLVAPVRPPNPMFEVVDPGYHRPPPSPGTVLKTLELAHRTQSRRRTFGRGQLNIK